MPPPDIALLAALDSARTAISAALLAAWEGEGAIEALRNRFVTGDWEEGQRRASAAPQGDEDEEAGEGEVRCPMHHSTAMHCLEGVDLMQNIFRLAIMKTSNAALSHTYISSYLISYNSIRMRMPLETLRTWKLGRL